MGERDLDKLVKDARARQKNAEVEAHQKHVQAEREKQAQLEQEGQKLLEELREALEGDFLKVLGEGEYRAFSGTSGPWKLPFGAIEFSYRGEQFLIVHTTQGNQLKTGIHKGGLEDFLRICELHPPIGPSVIEFLASFFRMVD